MDEEKKQIWIPNQLMIGITVVVIVISLLLSIYKIGSDRAKTKLTLLGDKEVILEAGENYEEKGFVAVSNMKDMTDKVVVTSNVNPKAIGNYEITYQLNILSLNYHQTEKRNIQIQDTTKPELKIDGKKTITHYIGDKFKVPTYKATDNYDGDITDKVKVTSNVKENKVGNYEINYAVKDSNGNETTDKVTVKVKKKKNPYVVVSISKQTLKYYEYDKLVLTSNVVTGVNNKTPKGTFRVLNKAQDIILKGADYESFVSYWIAFKGSSFGFHDASWRSNFGGKIYLNHGSHGCVNMPYSKVRQLYNMIDIGTPVYIKS